MKVDYKNDIESVLLSEEKLKEIVTSLGKQISDDYRDSGRKLLSAPSSSSLFTASDTAA